MVRKNAVAFILLAGLITWGVYDYMSKQAAEGDDAFRTDQAADSAIPEGLKVGQRAPDFTLMTADGTSVRLSDYRGSTVLLNFWASWCPPCQVEMPYMQDFYEEYRQKDVVVLAVNMSHLEKNPGDAAAFLDEVGASFPTVYDHQGEVTDRYRIVAYPTTYVLNASGVITGRYQGAIDHDLMVKAYERAR
ncbi:hypothetical protein XI25_14105 [Paenibacillus sp. DMB20]|nr:hypothetical protein XI25_14105 [Paenibacillus sp. DMB20]